MNYKKVSFAVLLLAGALAASGCVSTSELKNDGLDNRSDCESSLRENDQQVIRLQELVDDQQRQLRELNGQLKNCRKSQPNLK